MRGAGGMGIKQRSSGPLPLPLPMPHAGERERAESALNAYASPPLPIRT